MKVELIKAWMIKDGNEPFTEGLRDRLAIFPHKYQAEAYKKTWIPSFSLKVVRVAIITTKPKQPK